MRMFIALPLQAQSRHDIIKSLVPVKKRFPYLKWVREENLHITLQFLGDCSDREVEELSAIFSDRVIEYRACSITWGTLSAFPSGKSPRVYHIPVERGASCIREIYHGVSGLISDLMKDRGDVASSVTSFIPHITIARTGRGVPPVPLEKILSIPGNTSGESYVNRISLFRSILDKKGPIYEEKGFLRLREDT